MIQATQIARVEILVEFRREADLQLIAGDIVQISKQPHLPGKTIQHFLPILRLKLEAYLENIWKMWLYRILMIILMRRINSNYPICYTPLRDKIFHQGT